MFVSEVISAPVTGTEAGGQSTRVGVGLARAAVHRWNRHLSLLAWNRNLPRPAGCAHLPSRLWCRHSAVLTLRAGGLPK